MDVTRHDILVVAGFVLVWLSLVSCGGGDTSEPMSTSELVAGVAEVAPGRPRIVVLGDSLTSGLGLRSDEAYPARLQEQVRAEGYDYEVVTAGVSGDTTAGGLRRLEWVLEGDVRILVVALGGNDGLRGLPVAQMKENLGEIITCATEREIAVLLAGMEAPPNFGALYTDQFREAFRALAREHDIVFVPFLLDGVAGNADLNQADGIHPNAEGAQMVAVHLWPALQRMLEADRRGARRQVREQVGA